MALFDQIRADLFTPQPAARPWVTLSYAQSLDGSITAKRGQPLGLSGRASMSLTHQLRAAHDAILVGIGTVLADDPRLTVRLVHGTDPQPVVLDSSLRTPPTARLLQRRPPVWICTSQHAAPDRRRELEAAGAQVRLIAANAEGQIDLHQLLDGLSALGVERLMVEGGAKIITGFLTSRLVDALVVTLAPVLVGGLRAVERTLAASSAGDAEAISLTIDHFPRLQGIGHGRLDDDLILWGHPQWKSS